MRRVKFIRELVIEEVTLTHPSEMRYQSYQKLAPILDMDGDCLSLDEPINEMIVSVNRFSRMNDGEIKDVYIAYSKEVQELIECPFDVLSGELKRRDKSIGELRATTDRLLDRIEGLCKMPFRNRLKFLFTGSAPL